MAEEMVGGERLPNLMMTGQTSQVGVEILEKRGFQVDQPASKLKGNVHFEEYW